MTSPATAVAALRAGELVVVPTDTVYGLACDPERESAVRRLYALKGREQDMPTAIVGVDVEAILECLPELRGRVEALLRALLPGALTLVVPNPAGRLPWLTGTRPDAIGVRVPHMEGPALEVLEGARLVAATSANLAGGPDPRRLGDVPGTLLEGVAAAVDGGALPGTPSTVVDATGPEPLVLREGAVPADVVLDALASL